MAEITPRTIVLLPNQTVTASLTGSAINVYKYPLTQARIRVTADAGTGTTPTLNVYVQNRITKAATTDLAGASTTGTVEWNDLVSFAQITTSASVQYASIVAGGNFVHAASDAALTVGTVQNGPLGLVWRVKLVVSGTGPSYGNVNVIAELIP